MSYTNITFKHLISYINITYKYLKMKAELQKRIFIQGVRFLVEYCLESLKMRR